MNGVWLGVGSLVAWLGVAGPAMADALSSDAGGVAPAPEDPALQELLQALDQETRIATRTRMNVDFVPGMVSVLYGGDLLNKGVRTVGEALELIPGVELSMASDSQMQVLIRGVGGAFSSGKLKLLLNGVPFNSTLSGATAGLRIPVEQVDRIEMIRGPGSTVYGEFAYSGVIDVITRSDGNQAYLRRGFLGNIGSGARWGYENAAGDWRLSLNVAGSNIDGDSVQAGPDVLRDTPFSRAPGPSNEKRQNRSAIARFEFGDFSLLAQWAKSNSGDAFGLANALPAPEPRIMRRADMVSVQAEQTWRPGRGLELRGHAGWLDYRLRSGLHQFYPPGFMGDDPTSGQPFYPDGLVGSPNYSERKYRTGAELNFSGMDDHQWLFGFEWLYTDTGDTWVVRNFDPNTMIPGTTVPAPAPLAEYRGDGNWLKEGLTRQAWGLFVQDQYNVSDRLTVTAGLRFDSYDDVGSANSPRLAAVYRLDERQTLKAQYASAFRPPSFLEIATMNNPVVGGNPDIESELIDTFEMGYIFNDGLSTARATLFWAALHRLIVIDPATGRYSNAGHLRVMGAELEFTRKFGRSLELDSALAFVEPRHEDRDANVSDVAHLTGSLGLRYRVLPGYLLNAQYRYVGAREREPGDPRADLPGYQRLDVTATAEHWLQSGFTLRAGVRNLLDERVTYPAPLVPFGGAVIPAYPQDYPRPGREFWLQASVDF